MKLFVPSCGTKLQLTKTWTFRLYYEYRNEAMLEGLYPGITQHKAYKDSWRETPVKKYVVTSLPKGTTLTISRVYIRSGANGELDSITFILPGGKPKVKAKRFWVKLEDANAIECKVTHTPNKEGMIFKAEKKTMERLGYTFNVAEKTWTGNP